MKSSAGTILQRVDDRIINWRRSFHNHSNNFSNYKRTSMTHPRTYLTSFLISIIVLIVAGAYSTIYSQDSKKEPMRDSNKIFVQKNIFIDTLMGATGGWENYKSEHTDVITTIKPDSVHLKFAFVSDVGWSSQSTRAIDTVNARAVSNGVKKFKPDIVLTGGDNSHGLGDMELIDSRFTTFYKNYIDSNRMFPALGNHDFYTNLARWFKIKYPLLFVNNKNYYDFVRSIIHFYVVNSEDSTYEVSKFYGEPDGVRKGSIQYNYMKGKRQLSTSKWNISYFHHGPYPNLQPQHLDMHSLTRCYGDSLGMNISLGGHSHEAYRQVVNGFNWLCAGNGGAGLNNPTLVPRRAECVWQDINFGFIAGTAYNDSIMFEFKDVNNVTKHSFPLYHQQSVKVKMFIEGLYENGTSLRDTVRAELRQSVFPYAKVDSSRSILNQNGNAIFYFPKSEFEKDYFLVVKHRNSIETWSNDKIRFNARQNINYDFTSSANKTAGDNVKNINGKYAIYSGDTNQDGMIDLSDIIMVHRDSSVFMTGYVPTDLNGDGFVDQSDVNIVFSNSNNFITKIIK